MIRREHLNMLWIQINNCQNTTSHILFIDYIWGVYRSNAKHVRNMSWNHHLVTLTVACSHSKEQIMMNSIINVPSQQFVGTWCFSVNHFSKRSRSSSTIWTPLWLTHNDVQNKEIQVNQHTCMFRNFNIPVTEDWVLGARWYYLFNYVAWRFKSFLQMKPSRVPFQAVFVRAKAYTLTRV